MKATKEVTYKHLQIGQCVTSWKEGHSTHLASATVKEVNSAFVTLLVFGRTEEKINSETTVFSVELSEQEFKLKYQKAAEEIVENIQTKLQPYEIGYHEMWNGWLDFDAYEMAWECEKEKIKILGHCILDFPKMAMFSGDCLDVGICAEHENGEKFWCHARHDDIDYMIERFNRCRNE